MRVDYVLNNFLQKNGFDCSAAYDVKADSYYDIDNEEITLGGKPDEEADRIFIKYLEELELNGEWNISLMTFMHELGHHMTLHLLSEEEEDESAKIKFFCGIISENFGDDEGACNMYFRCPEEAIATEWAVDFINNNIDMMREFEAELIEVIGG